MASAARGRAPSAGRTAPPPPPRAGAPPGKPPRFDAATWLALLVLGVLLFGGGIYLALSLDRTFGIVSSLPRTGPLVYLPYALCIAGGALGTYAYEEWWQSADRQQARGRAARLRELPSYEHYVPPRNPNGP